MTANEAIELLVNFCKQHGECSTRQAAEKLKPQLSELTSKARWDLMVWGLSYCCRAGFTCSTSGPSGRQAAVDARNGDKIDPPRNILLEVFYQGADGIRKPLIDFTVDDLSHFRKGSLHTMVALKKRIDAADFAKSALLKHGAHRIGDLPSKVLKDVRNAWEEVFSVDTGSLHGTSQRDFAA